MAALLADLKGARSVRGHAGDLHDRVPAGCPSPRAALAAITMAGGTFVSWLAGAGIKGGTAHGESDEFSYLAAKDVTTGSMICMPPCCI